MKEDIINNKAITEALLQVQQYIEDNRLTISRLETELKQATLELKWLKR